MMMMMMTMMSVCCVQVRFPPEFGADIRDLITNLLQVDITRRFGCMKPGVADIKTHHFFSETDWIALFEHKVWPRNTSHNLLILIYYSTNETFCMLIIVKPLSGTIIIIIVITRNLKQSPA